MAAVKGFWSMAYLRSKNGAPRRPHPAEVARGNRFLRPAPDKAIARSRISSSESPNPVA